MLYQKLHVYWDGHYTFLKKSKLSEKSIGFDAVRHILINAFIPFMYTFGVKRTLPELKSWAIKMLEETKAESNTIIRDFAFLNLKAKNAYQSQGLVQLKNEYCNFRNCLNCAIGKHLIRR